MKWLLIVPGIILAVVFGLIILALLTVMSVRLTYINGDLKVVVGIYGVKIRVYPMKVKKKKPQKPQKPQKSPAIKEPFAIDEQGQSPNAAQAERNSQKEKHKSAISMPQLDIQVILEYTKLIIIAAKRMLKNIKVNYIKMDCSIASDDAASTAMTYGGVAVALSTLLPVLEEVFIIKKKDIAVNADFEGSSSRFDVDIKLSTIAYKMVISMLIIYLKFRKIQKGRCKNEQSK